MFQNFNDAQTLANGVKIPCVGYGTWKTPNGETARNCVRAAIERGYRHIDTAAAYGNEASVGEGMRASGVKREALFVTTKHWITERGYEKTIAACEASLARMKLDYIDLYLIHWPAVEKISPEWRQVNAATWRGFETLYRQGKIRAIGVSNFLPAHLEALKQTCEVFPMVNQIEYHPGYTQDALVKYCAQNHIAVEAWSPLGSGAVLNNEFLAGIAAKYGKNTAQLCVRFALQNGVIPLPKSSNLQRMDENKDVFDFTISNEDMARIRAMEITGYSGYSPEDAPADSL